MCSDACIIGAEEIQDLSMVKATNYYSNCIHSSDVFFCV